VLVPVPAGEAPAGPALGVEYGARDWRLAHVLDEYHSWSKQGDVVRDCREYTVVPVPPVMTPILQLAEAFTRRACRQKIDIFKLFEVGHHFLAPDFSE
jgi:hypothetical protein